MSVWQKTISIPTEVPVYWNDSAYISVLWLNVIFLLQIWSHSPLVVPALQRSRARSVGRLLGADESVPRRLGHPPTVWTRGVGGTCLGGWRGSAAGFHRLHRWVDWSASYGHELTVSAACKPFSFTTCALALKSENRVTVIIYKNTLCFSFVELPICDINLFLYYFKVKMTKKRT